MSKRAPRAFNPPERIYLQVGDMERDCEFDECNEVPWCDSPIFDTDIEYRLVRPSRHKRSIKTEHGK